MEEQVEELSTEVSDLNIDEKIDEAVGPVQEQVDEINTAYQEADELIVENLSNVDNSLRNSISQTGITALNNLRDFGEWRRYPIENDIEDIYTSGNDVYIFRNDVRIQIKFRWQVLTFDFCLGDIIKDPIFNLYVFPEDYGNNAHYFIVYKINMNNIRLGGTQTTVEGRAYNLITNEASDISQVFLRNGSDVSAPSNIIICGRKDMHQ